MLTLIFPAEPDLSDLPIIDQIAVMMMHESQVARTVVKHLRAEVDEGPCMADYHRLAAQGMCMKRPADRWHRLTPEGHALARALERHLCQHYGIHLLLRSGEFAGGMAAFRCPCGWSIGVQRSPSGENSARRAFGGHIGAAGGMRKAFVALPVKVGAA